MAQQRRFDRNTIAIVYDFDGTLSAKAMQDYELLPELGVKPKQFWRRVTAKSKETVSEKMLVYMRLLVERAEQKQISIKREDLKAMGRSIKYFPGVEKWFGRMNRFVAKESNKKVRVRHYIISAGLKDMLDGITIKKHFGKIYASEYHFDHNGVARFPKVLITDTIKTQYLFRINKGKEHLGESINEHMPLKDRPIPFSNIIYIGDGISDVPSMALTKRNGGHSLAVYKSRSDEDRNACKRLLRAGRVDLIAAADYRPDRQLDRHVKVLLGAVIAEIACNKQVFECRKHHKVRLHA